MAKSIKTEWLGTRADTALATQVKDYVRETESNQAEMLRKALIEYMINHPLKPKRQTPNLSPGE